jgi:hypothetical protein
MSAGADQRDMAVGADLPVEDIDAPLLGHWSAHDVIE